MKPTLQTNFHSKSSAGENTFKPAKKNAPKCVDIFLNSQDKMQGTNDDATFSVNLGQEFVSDKLRVRLKNFIPSYPTNTNEGILNVNLLGLDNPHSFSSSNLNTHRTLATMWLNEGQPKPYPPVGFNGSNTMVAANLPYGNGTYVAAQTSTATWGPVWHGFSRDFYTSNVANTAVGGYSNQT
jgi:hypothetical protein